MNRAPRNCPHCFGPVRSWVDFGTHLKWYCPALLGREPQSNVFNLRPVEVEPDAIFDWANDPEMAVDTDPTPPHGIARERFGDDGLVCTHVG